MCPSYRVTRDEEHLTRGRANTLRLALTGQLGADAMASDEVAEAMSLCVSCKACRRECPTGVDMAKMKIEVLGERAERHRAVARRSADRRVAADCAVCGAAGAAVRICATDRRDCALGGDALRHRGVAPPALLAAAISSATRRLGPLWCRRATRRGAAVRRYVQPLVRAGEFARGGARAGGGGISRARCRPCAADGSAAAARCFRSGGSMRRGRRRGAWWRRWPAMRRSLAWSRPAC